MITLMTLTAIGTALYVLFGTMGFVIRVFGKAIGFVLGLVLLIPAIVIFLIGSGIAFLPIFAVLALLVGGAKRIAHM